MPESIQRLFAKHDIQAEVTPEAEDLALQMAFQRTNESLNKVVLPIVLENAAGLYLALIPGNHMLDLNALNELVGGHLQAAPVKTLESIKRRLRMETIPPYPSMVEAKAIVDESLLAKDNVFISTGNVDGLVCVSQDKLAQVIEIEKKGIISQPIPVDEKEINFEDDINVIQKSVGSFTQLVMKKRLDETLDIPPLSETARKVLELKTNPDADAVQLTEVIETDPSLAAQVVSWASSPYYAVQGNISSVKDAIVRVLGFDLVLNLALGLSLSRQITLPSDGPHGYYEYWKQSVFCAVLMGRLVQAAPKKPDFSQGTAYLAGLLHNFGYLILGHVFPPQFELINKHIVANRHVETHMIEKYFIQTHRNQLCSSLLQQWNMPEEIYMPIRFQDVAEYKGRYLDMANLMFLAKQGLRKHGIGDCKPLATPQGIYEYFGFTPEDVDEVVDQLFVNSEEIEYFVSQMANG